MKKIHLVELVQDFLASDMPEDMISQYHPEIIKKYIELAYNQVVYLTWLNGKKFSDFSQLDAWTRTYSLELFNPTIVVAPTSTVSGNIRLPFPPIQLPNNMGIRQVAPHTDETIVFAYMESTAVSIFEELDVFTIDPTPFFRLEQNDSGSGIESHILKIQKLPLAFHNPPITTMIDVKLIVPFDKIGDYEDVAMPSGQEDILVKQAVEFLKAKPPEDTANDQNANRPNQ